MPFFGEAAKKIAGEKNPRDRIEGTESAGEMEIRGEDEFQFSAPEIYAPAHFFNAAEGHVESQVFEQGDGPPMA